MMRDHNRVRNRPRRLEDGLARVGSSPSKHVPIRNQEVLISKSRDKPSGWPQIVAVPLEAEEQGLGGGQLDRDDQNRTLGEPSASAISLVRAQHGAGGFGGAGDPPCCDFGRLVALNLGRYLAWSAVAARREFRARSSTR